MKFDQYAPTETSPELEAWYQQIADESSGEFDPAHIRQALEAGTHAGFYVSTDAGVRLGIILITMMRVVNDESCLVVMGATGEVLGQWHEVDSLLTELAQLYNCTTLSIRGRKGFAKVFKEFGWSDQYTVLYRKVPALEAGG